MHYADVLLSETDGRFYTGTTADLGKRLGLHAAGRVRSTGQRPLKLLYYEACLHPEDAYRRERFLTSGKGGRYLGRRRGLRRGGLGSPVTGAVSSGKEIPLRVEGHRREVAGDLCRLPDHPQHRLGDLDLAEGQRAPDPDHARVGRGSEPDGLERRGDGLLIRVEADRELGVLGDEANTRAPGATPPRSGFSKR